MRRARDLKHALRSNLSYKVVSLFVAIILWLTLLGHRDASLTRDVSVEFMMAAQHQIVGTRLERVTVSVSGPRMALRRFSQKRTAVLVDLSSVQKGQAKIDLKKVNLNLPLGVKLVSIEPQFLSVIIGEQGNGRQNGN